MLVITVEDAQGNVRPELGRTYSATFLAGLPYDVDKQYTRFDGFDNGPLSGVSISELIAQMQLPAKVDGVTFNCPGMPGGVYALSAGVGDLADPAVVAEDDYPFLDDAPPVFAPAFNTGDSQGQINFAVNKRKAGFTDPSLTDGQLGFAGPSTPMTMTLRLGAPLVPVRVRASPNPAQVDQTVTFTAEVDDPDRLNRHEFAWNFGDGKTADTHTASSTQHVYSAAGPFTATVTVTSASGSGGSAQVPVDVKGPKPATTKTTPPGPGRGTGESAAPTAGPVTGSGPRVGGDATGRGGGGSAGPSFDPRSASGVDGADGAAPIAGNVIGYLLSDANGVVQNPRAAIVPRNNSAPAARDGVESFRIAGWVVGLAVVAALLVLGAGSERRRPTFTRARRKQ